VALALTSRLARTGAVGSEFPCTQFIACAQAILVLGKTVYHGTCFRYEKIMLAGSKCWHI
jgi:hypothetical protein